MGCEDCFLLKQGDFYYILKIRNGWIVNCVHDFILSGQDFRPPA